MTEETQDQRQVAARPRTGLLEWLRAKEFGFFGWLAIAIILMWCVVAAFAPWIAPYSESDIVLNESYAPANWTYLLGTDYLGRDLLSRLIYGARMTLTLALVATGLAFLFGVAVGFLAGLRGGLVDVILSRINDVFISIPQIMLALIVVTGLGSSLAVLIATIAFIEGTRVYRLARALAQDVNTRDFIELSRARGESTGWIMVNEVLPNSVGPLLTEFGLRFTYSILLLSALSFLGLGVQPPAADWGGMVKENLTGISFGAPAAIAPALAILSLTMAINLLVDWQLNRQKRTISAELIG